MSLVHVVIMPLNMCTYLEAPEGTNIAFIHSFNESLLPRQETEVGSPRLKCNKHTHSGSMLSTVVNNIYKKS